MRQGSKYIALHEHLRRSGKDEVILTFAQIEKLLGDKMPTSARQSRAYWSNRRQSALQAAAWMEAGYHVADLDLERERVTFRKPLRKYTIRREGNTVLWDGELIRALRQHMGLNQAQMAEVLGVRQQTVSEWETGMYAPSRATSKYLTLVAERADFKYGEGK
ncbi:MAG: helix-turn-helix domain-containing protein [Anaerolineales bacterium]